MSSKKAAKRGKKRGNKDEAKAAARTAKLGAAAMKAARDIVLWSPAWDNCIGGALAGLATLYAFFTVYAVGRRRAAVLGDDAPERGGAGGAEEGLTPQ